MNLVTFLKRDDFGLTLERALFGDGIVEQVVALAGIVGLRRDDHRLTPGVNPLQA